MAQLRIAKTLSAFALIAFTGCQQRMTSPTLNPAGRNSKASASVACDVDARLKTKSKAVTLAELKTALTEGQYQLVAVNNSVQPDKRTTTSIAVSINVLPAEIVDATDTLNVLKIVKASAPTVNCQKFSASVKEIGALLDAPLLIEMPAGKVANQWSLDYMIAGPGSASPVSSSTNSDPTASTLDTWLSDFAKKQKTTAKISLHQSSETSFEVLVVETIAREKEPVQILKTRYFYGKLSAAPATAIASEPDGEVVP